MVKFTTVLKPENACVDTQQQVALFLPELHIEQTCHTNTNMKRFLSFLLLFPVYSYAGSPTIGGPISGGGPQRATQLEVDARANVPKYVSPDRLPVTGGTNTVFTSGQNTTWRTAGGSNVVDVVGVLTNPLATATIYVNRVEATNASSLILSGGGQDLEIGSGTATFAGAGGFSGYGGNLTGVQGVQNINARNIKNSDGAAGNGSTDDRAAIASADAAVSATNGAFYLPPGTYRISSDLTTTNTAWFAPGAKVSVDSGITWWHRGPLIADETQQIFSGSGTVLFQTNYFIDSVSVDWFGANSADVQKAVNAARIKQSEMYEFSASYPSGPRQNMWAHFPAMRRLVFRSSGEYVFTNTVTFQEVWHGEVDGQNATIYALFPTTTNAVFQFNDVRYLTFQNFIIKTYMGSNCLAALRFDNISTVETSTTPFDNAITKVKIYGHQKGFQFGVMGGMGIDNNNERFIFTDCAILDYERAGVLLKGSQAFDHLFINCTFSGGLYGWFGVSAFDPTWAPSGSGSFHVIGGGGGANIIADFCANSFRQTEISLWDSESSLRLYVDPFFPVPTNTFSFDAGGTSFYGTNTLVAGFVLGNTNWVQTTYTNDYTAHANKDVWEYLVSTGGVQRIAVTSGARPYNPTYATEGVTLFNIVRVGNGGITNYDKTWGQLAGNSGTKTQPVSFKNFNFSSDRIPWDGTVVLAGSPRPFTFQGRWRTVTNHAKFGLYTATTSGDDGSIDFHGSSFNVENAATPPPTDEERVMLFRADGTLDTNKVNGNFVGIIGGNNIHASVPDNVTSNLTGAYVQRMKMELVNGSSLSVVGPISALTNYTDWIEATNSSSLKLSGGGQTLEIGSGSANFAGGSGFTGIGANLSYTGSGNDGNLATSVDTLQELNDAVDNLASGQLSQAITQGHTADIVISNATTAFRGNVGIGTNTPAVPLEIRKDSPSANEILFRVATSDDNSRVTIDEDGDAVFDGSLASGTYVSANSYFTWTSSARNRFSAPADGVALLTMGDGTTRLMSNTNGLLYLPGSLVINSNSWTNVITLANGEARLASSNGVPYVIAKDAAGALSTNLVGGSGGGGSGNGAWQTNAVTGVTEPNLSPYDLATKVIVVPQDMQFLGSNGTSSRIFYEDESPLIEFGVNYNGGFELNVPGGGNNAVLQAFNSASGGYALVDTNGDRVLNWENGVTIPSGTVSGELSVGSLKFSTNAGAMNPDFSKPYQKFGTNNNFVFLAPSNVELTYKTNVQTCVVLVTNVAKGSLMTVSPPANCWPQGTWNVTNNGVTTFTFFTYAGQWTNAVALPLF